LHLTDIHFDPEYQEGTSIDCGEPLCCRPESRYQPEHRRTQALADMDKAGFWGEYRGCDMPWRTIENTINHIAEAHKVPLDKFYFLLLRLLFHEIQYNAIFWSLLQHIKINLLGCSDKCRKIKIKIDIALN
jgi:hypothetical protein